MIFCDSCRVGFDENDLDEAAAHIRCRARSSVVLPATSVPRLDVLDEALENELRRERITLSPQTRALVLRVVRRIVALVTGETPDGGTPLT